LPAAVETVAMDADGTADLICRGVRRWGSNGNFTGWLAPRLKKEETGE